MMHLPDIENTGNSSVRSKTNQVDSNAKEDRDPYCIERSSGLWVDAGPDRGEGQQSISREGKNGPAK
jgi:hypothetical protein